MGFISRLLFGQSAFGMNIIEINPEESASSMTLAKYFEVSLPLTFVTVWIVIAYQINIEDPRAVLDMFNKDQRIFDGQARELTWQNEIALKASGKRYRKLGVFSKLLWPFFLIMNILERKKLVADMLGGKAGSNRLTTPSGSFKLPSHA
jgi:hypothetical protein